MFEELESVKHEVLENINERHKSLNKVLQDMKTGDSSKLQKDLEEIDKLLQELES